MQNSSTSLYSSPLPLFPYLYPSQSIRMSDHHNNSLSYSPVRISLYSNSYLFVDCIINNIELWDVRRFSVLDMDLWELCEANELLLKYNSFYELTREAEDNYRFVGFMAELKNRITIRTELELTFVYAKNARALFDFCRPVFVFLGLDAVKLERRLRDHPNQTHQCLPYMTLGSNPDNLLDCLNRSLFPPNFLSSF